MTIPIVNQLKTKFPYSPDAGTVNTIPDINTDPLNPQNASFQKGFPAITMPLTGSTGRPPNGQDMNGILNSLSQLGVWYSVGGGFNYNGTLYNNSNPYITGYPVGARVKRADNRGYWLNFVNNNQTDPDNPVSSVGWLPDSPYGYYNLIVPNAGTILMNVDTVNAAFDTIVISPAIGVTLVSNITVTIPETLIKNYTFHNNTPVFVSIKTTNVASNSYLVPPFSNTKFTVLNVDAIAGLSNTYLLSPAFGGGGHYYFEGDCAPTAVGTVFTPLPITQTVGPLGWIPSNQIKPTFACVLDISFYLQSVKTSGGAGDQQIDILFNNSFVLASYNFEFGGLPNKQNTMVTKVDFNGTTDFVNCRAIRAVGATSTVAFPYISFTVVPS